MEFGNVLTKDILKRVFKEKSFPVMKVLYLRKKKYIHVKMFMIRRIIFDKIDKNRKCTNLVLSFYPISIIEEYDKYHVFQNKKNLEVTLHFIIGRKKLWYIIFKQFWRIGKSTSLNHDEKSSTVKNCLRTSVIISCFL